MLLWRNVTPHLIHWSPPNLQWTNRAGTQMCRALRIRNICWKNALWRQPSANLQWFKIFTSAKHETGICFFLNNPSHLKRTTRKMLALVTMWVEVNSTRNKWRSHRNIFFMGGGAKCLILGDQTYFVDNRLSKEKMTKYAKNFCLRLCWKCLHCKWRRCLASLLCNDCSCTYHSNVSEPVGTGLPKHKCQVLFQQRHAFHGAVSTFRQFSFYYQQQRRLLI